jgi:hypothetical protein
MISVPRPLLERLIYLADATPGQYFRENRDAEDYNALLSFRASDMEIIEEAGKLLQAAPEEEE